MSGLRLVFAGTPEFAVPALQVLLDEPPLAVYTQPDRPAGRGRRLRASAVKQAAAAAGIPVRQPQTLRDADTQAALAALEPDLMVVVAYGLLLPQSVLDIPRLGCVNLHASLLPRWRGAAPIQRALLAGDRDTGVTLMQMDAGLDTGPVLGTSAVTIGADDTAGTLHDTLSRLGADLLRDSLPALAAGELVAAPQDSALATHAPKLTRNDARIDWYLPAARIARQVMGLNPWPVAETTIDGARLRILRAREVAGETSGAVPGTVLAADRDINVACGRGVLRVGELQLAGGRALPAQAFANGHRIAGAVLGVTGGS